MPPAISQLVNVTQSVMPTYMPTMTAPTTYPTMLTPASGTTVVSTAATYQLQAAMLAALQLQQLSMCLVLIHLFVASHFSCLCTVMYSVCTDLHTAQLMPLPLTVPCSSKIQIGFTFLVPAYLGSPGQKAVKRMYVCISKRDQCIFGAGVRLPLVVSLLLMLAGYEAASNQPAC